MTIKLQHGGFVNQLIAPGESSITVSKWAILDEIELDTTDINVIMKTAHALLWEKDWKSVIVSGEGFHIELNTCDLMGFD